MPIEIGNRSDVVDWKMLRALRELIDAGLIEQFTEEARANIDAAQAQLAAGDSVRAKQFCHRLAGISADVGALALAELAKTLEATLGESVNQLHVELGDELLPVFDETLTLISEFVDSPYPGPEPM